MQEKLQEQMAQKLQQALQMPEKMQQQMTQNVQQALQMQEKLQEQKVQNLQQELQVQEKLKEQMALQERMALLQLMELKRKYWEQLFLTTIEMSEAELRTTLKHRSTARRFAAAYVVGERLLEWPNDLIPLLEDKSGAVRQGARRSLIILSFLALNPEEARRIRSPQRKGTVTSLSELAKPMDFGPNPGTKPKEWAQSAKQWREWWADRESQRAMVSRNIEAIDNPTARSETASQRMASELLRAVSQRRQEIVAKYRESKGVQYTEALAIAIPRESGEERRKLREALNDRMARMTEETLGQYLEDEDAEIRRAAALGLAMKESKAHFDKLIGLLLDSQPMVERAAHAALRSLSGKDFGPRVNATEAEKGEAAKNWRQWWGSRPK